MVRASARQSASKESVRPQGGAREERHRVEQRDGAWVTIAEAVEVVLPARAAARRRRRAPAREQIPRSAAYSRTRLARASHREQVGTTGCPSRARRRADRAPERRRRVRDVRERKRAVQILAPVRRRRRARRRGRGARPGRNQKRAPRLERPVRRIVIGLRADMRGCPIARAHRPGARHVSRS
jgi:hypothetical protein